jgi:hypothetical protein
MTVQRIHHPESGGHGEAFSPNTVWHIGDLSGSREKPYLSYEGGGVSVSTHPDAWMEILQGECGLSGAPPRLYELTADTVRFRSVDPAVNLHEEREWAVDHRYIQERQGFEVSWENKRGKTQYFRFTDRRTAELEAEERDVSVKETPVLTLDERGEQYWEQTFRQPPLEAEPIVIEGLLPVWYARHHGYDGVWWHEELAPSQHSAPRGVIFQSALEDFTITEIDVL